MPDEERKRKQKIKEEYQIKFGKYLRAFRLSKGIGLRELEKDCDVDRHTTSRIELGKKTANLRPAWRTASAVSRAISSGDSEV